MRANTLALLTILVVLGASPVARAEWPIDWPFLRSEQGWFFYKEPPSPKLPTPSNMPAQTSEPVPNELTDDSIIIPIPPLVPVPTDELEGTLGPGQAGQEPEANASITLKLIAPGAASAAPVTGLALEAWLLKLSDHDIQQIIGGVKAGELRTWIPILLDQALTTTDRRSVRKYLLAQQESLRRSDKFSKVWQEIVWTDPTFDRPGTWPTGTLAQHLYEQERARTRTATLAALGRSVHLLLVVGPACDPCEVQWKILKGWSDRVKLSVRPIARELVTLADGTLAMPYPTVIASLDVRQLPSLFIVEPASGYLTRLGSGLLSEDEVVTRILRLVPEQRPKGALEYVTAPSLAEPDLPQPFQAPE